jgi:hypothetical protein
MKTVTVTFKDNKFIYTCTSEVTTDDLHKIKYDYHYILEERFSSLRKGDMVKVVIDIEFLPVLEHSLTKLQDYMKRNCSNTNVATWNFYRQEAKSMFRWQCINQLDASGFISKIIKHGRKESVSSES